MKISDKDMIEKTNNSIDGKLRYISPQIKEIPVNVQNVICQSGGPMYEKDHGNGGFHNV